MFPRTHNLNTRIGLDDNLVSALVAISGGDREVEAAALNPGDLFMYETPEDVQGMCMPGPYGMLLSLDAMGVYGQDVVKFYEAVGKSHDDMVRVMALRQQGQLDQADLADIIDRGETITSEQIQEMLAAYNETRAAEKAERVERAERADAAPDVGSA